ncbi:MAG: phenylalanine--tRNA ligase subunit alpha [Chloroflexi bacterium]|nr:phenylalanine--tRNA ligase subunit alpha [Chloroflexota bacterium]
MTRFRSVNDNAEAELNRARDTASLEAWRIKYLGRRGQLSELTQQLGKLTLDQRRDWGPLVNNVKSTLEAKFAAAQNALERQAADAKLASDQLDVTLPGRPVTLGRLHPVTQMVREICAAFTSMGFDVVEGPEVEWERYNFDLLNIPRDHPARDMWDTLWIDWTDPTPEGRRMLLRTHTSPMQGRIMEKAKPPIRVIVPGKVFRHEATDARHEWHFYQVEGLAVDKDITFADLKGTLYEFARRIFGADRRIRFRCDYFPFVEPGVDVSVDCFICKGTGVMSNGHGCRVCSATGWLEIMGAGMVHPNVFKAVGYDPEEYTGFAFGMGPERIAMLKYGIDDIRHFYANDVRFLRQF